MQEQPASSLAQDSSLPWMSSTSPPQFMEYVFEGLAEVCALVLDGSCEKTFTVCDVWSEIYESSTLLTQAYEFLLRNERGECYDGEGEEVKCIELDFEHVEILLDSLVKENRAKIVPTNSSMKVYTSLEETRDSDDDSSNSSSSSSDGDSSSECDR